MKHRTMNIAGIRLEVDFEIDGDAVQVEGVRIVNENGTESVDITKPVLYGKIWVKDYLTKNDLLSEIESWVIEDLRDIP